MGIKMIFHMAVGSKLKARWKVPRYLGCFKNEIWLKYLMQSAP